ncbi:MAG: Methyltransferase type 12 [Myxococcales bacterium]|nr:Methyltransferase type 12 [Myxococcales bacterium]
MYSENPRRDTLLFMRASLTNLLALFPFYLRLGNRSGRGRANERPEDAAAYFLRCVSDYFAELAVDASFVRGKRVLEYGPGDTLGVALLLYAHGAETVHSVDHFPVHRITSQSAAIYRAILESLDGEARARAESAFVEPGNPQSGFDPAKIEYRVTRHGVSGRRRHYDLVLSRSVLALVDRLDETLADIAAALRPGGVSIHKVDLSSHGLDRDRPFDFLTWPDPLYQLMYSRKGRPNRLRVDRYQALAKAAGLRIRKLAPTGHLSDAEVAFIRPRLDPAFRDVPGELLSWLGFWLVLEPY